MLDKGLIREKLDWVHQRLETKNFKLDQEEFVRLDEEERSLRVEWEDLRALRNRTSEEIAEQKKQGKAGEEKIAQMKEVSARIKELDEQVKASQTRMHEFLSVIPNLPHESVPVGADESSNSVVREVGEPPQFDFEVKDHVDLGVNLGILDPERAGKIAGARFTNYSGSGALLERALMNFMLHVHTR